MNKRVNNIKRNLPQRFLIGFLLWSFIGCGGGQVKISKTQRLINRRIYQANVYYKNGNFDECLNRLKKLLQIDRNDPYIHYNMGVTYAGMSEYDLAEKEYKKALAVTEKIPEVFKGLGDLYYRKGLYQEAVDAYFTGLKLSPKSTEFRVCMAKSYEAMNKKNLAIRQYHNYLLLSRNSGFPPILQARYLIPPIRNQQQCP